jgi:ABC-2 type transport system permease protein
MSQVGALSGAIRYEFAMQVRRPALWIVFGLLGSFTIFVADQIVDSYLKLRGGPGGALLYGHREVAISWVQALATLMPLGAGLLLADRVPRDTRTRVIELLRTAPASAGARLLGKYLGAVLATLVPIAVVGFVGFAVLQARLHDLSTLPEVLAAFAALLLPPIFFVAAFSLAGTMVLWAPLYQFLFVGYWLWSGLNPAESIPTLNNTFLSPTENYVITGFFHIASPYAADALRYPTATVWHGIANIATLLACAALALIAAWRWQAWQANHQ